MIRRSRCLIPAAVAIVLFAVPCLWFARARRLVQLDHELAAAVVRDDAEAVDSLLAAGANPNARDASDMRLSVLQILRNVFHPSRQDLPQPVLVTAVQLDTSQIVKALVSAGADVNATMKGGASSLMIAAIEGRTDTISVLCSAGAVVNNKDDEGNSALSDAAGQGRNKTARILIGQGADVNAKDIFGCTALMRAVRVRSVDTTSTLIACKADLNARDNHGKTALDHAKGDRIPRMVILLRKAGAKE